MESLMQSKAFGRLLVWAVMHEGRHAGHVLGKWAERGNGCTVTVNIWSGPLAMGGAATARDDGGGGYDKWSSAFVNAIRSIRDEKIGHLSGQGIEACGDWIKGHGYDLVKVVH